VPAGFTSTSSDLLYASDQGCNDSRLHDLEMSDENEEILKNQDSTLTIAIGMLLTILASVYVLYSSGTLGRWR